MAKLVTVATYTDSIQGELARARLNECDIACVIHGGQSIRHPNGTFGQNVRLQVNEEDVEAARTLLTLDVSGYDDELTALEAEGSDSPEAEEMPKLGGHCPRCDSDNVMVTPFTWDKFFWSAFLLFLPLLFLKRDHECAMCGMTWRA